MHWVIFAELKKFSEAALGPDAWDKLLAEAKLGSKSYLSKVEYPDADAVAIAGAASRLTGKPVPALLEAFGEFLVPDYLRLYGMLVRPEWRTIEAIENTESMIHQILRVRDPNAKPPELRCERISPDEVLLTYDSARRLCGVAKGIARGLAVHYREKLTVSESACMNAGAPACRITFRRTR